MTQDQIDFARAAIVAKAAYWDALREFETMTAGRAGEWEDYVNDAAIAIIEHLAGEAGDTAADPEYVSDPAIEVAFGKLFVPAD